MSISRERLDTLIAETAHTAQTWKDFDAEVSAKNPEYESIVQSKCDDLLSALEELKSIRQAATVGVEAAAVKLAGRRLPYQFIRAELTVLLAPYMAVLGECKPWIVSSLIRQRDVGAMTDYRELQELVAKIDALTKGGV